MEKGLDYIAIISGIASLVFWISSNQVYRDILENSRAIKGDMDKQEVYILSRIGKQIQHIVTRISASESRLEYLEKVIVKDEGYSAFVDKLGNLLEDSDFC
jgi:hypothetical protein